MPTPDKTLARAVAERIAEDQKLAILKRNYLAGGGSERDFVTELETVVELAIDPHVLA